jgi:hypothetical protein
MTVGELTDHLERYIDGNGLAAAIGLLETICWAKAEHVQEAWQDKAGARHWTDAAGHMERVAVSPLVTQCPLP